MNLGYFGLMIETVSRKKLKKVSVLACCVCLLLVGLASAGAAEEEGTVLQRVKAIKDPELAQLLQVALENLSEDAAITRPELVRRVTEAYAQIKLLDIQITDIDRKIELSKTSEVVREKQRLQRAKLEAERMTQLAKLREAMYVEPRYALGRIPVDELNGWLTFNVGPHNLDVSKFLKPYYEDLHRNKLYPLWGTTPEARDMVEETIAYVKNLIKNQEIEVPLRIDIFRTLDGYKLSEELYKRVIQMVRDEKLEMHTEVIRHKGFRPFQTDWNLLLGQGKVRYYDTREKGMEAEEMVRRITDVLRRPNTVLWPYKVHIKVLDHESKTVAKHITEALQKAAKESGVEELLQIEQEESISGLNSWLALDVIGDDVHAYEYSKPYCLERTDITRCRLVKRISHKEAIAYVKDFIKTRTQLPLRIDIYRTEASSKASEELYNHLKKVVIEAKLEMKAAKVYLVRYARPDVCDYTWILKQGEVRHGDMLIPATAKLQIFIKQRLTNPGQLPVKLHIEFDQESKDVATNIVEGIQKAAKEFGVEQFVEIERKEMDPE